MRNVYDIEVGEKLIDNLVETIKRFDMHNFDHGPQKFKRVKVIVEVDE